MINRMARKKIKTTQLDMIKPLDLTQFGASDDPCFGKHHDPQVAECQRCGDAEVCSIVCSQIQHLTRDKVEQGQKFKDIEPTELKKEDTINQVIFDKLNTKKDKKMKLKILASFIKDNVASHAKHTRLEILKALRKDIKSSSLFQIDKVGKISYIKIK